MRLRGHLTYANVMATIAVFGVLAGGGAYAASKIDTPDIATRAVTTKKLDKQAVSSSRLARAAVTGSKLANGAIQSRHLSPEATGAVAGVVVYNGEIRGWFDRFSEDPPTLEHTSPGVYELGISGIDPERDSSLSLLSSASLIGVSTSQAGEISTRWAEHSDGSALHPIVHTYDSSGTPADRSFTYIVYRADRTVQ